MRIGVLSDTHIPRRAKGLPAQMLRAFESVEMILHAGDLVSLSVLRELERIAPTFAVRGNVDPPEVAEVLPACRTISVGRFQIGLVHGDQGTAGTTPLRALEAFIGEEVACVVFGHSHQPYNQPQKGVHLFNPGSPTDPRWERRPSYGILRVEEEIRGEIVLL